MHRYKLSIKYCSSLQLWEAKRKGKNKNTKAEKKKNTKSPEKETEKERVKREAAEAKKRAQEEKRQKEKELREQRQKVVQEGGKAHPVQLCCVDFWVVSVRPNSHLQ